MKVKCMCVKLCVRVHVNWLKGGVAMGVDDHKKVHNFDIDSQICTRCCGKVDHDPNNS